MSIGSTRNPIRVGRRRSVADSTVTTPPPSRIECSRFSPSLLCYDTCELEVIRTRAALKPLRRIGSRENKTSVAACDSPARESLGNNATRSSAQCRCPLLAGSRRVEKRPIAGVNMGSRCMAELGRVHSCLTHLFWMPLYQGNKLSRCRKICDYARDGSGEQCLFTSIR